jgi:hypothetical protein
MATVTFSEKFNNAVSYLNGAITNVATTINVDSATALGLDNSTTSAYLTIISASSYRKDPLTSPETLEIVKVTAVSTNALTVTRGADNTTGLAFDDNDIIEMRNNVANLEDIQNAITDGTDDIKINRVEVGDDSNSVTIGNAAIQIDDAVGTYIAMGVANGATKDLFLVAGPDETDEVQIQYAETPKSLRIGTKVTGGDMVFRTDDNQAALTLDSSQNATFGSNMSVPTGFINFGAKTVKTISSGAITATTTNTSVEPESGTADDLVTINGGTDGDILIIRPNTFGDTITLKHASGNIYLNAGADEAMNNRLDRVMLVFDGVFNFWVAVSESNNA